MEPDRPSGVQPLQIPREEPLPLISSADWDELQRLADEQQAQQQKQPLEVQPRAVAGWLARGNVLR